MKVFDNNTYHFFEVSNALASYIYVQNLEDKGQLETDDLCFDLINRNAMSKFPDLKTPSDWNSKDMFKLMFLQGKIREVLERLRKKKEEALNPQPVRSFQDPNPPPLKPIARINAWESSKT